MGRGEPMENKVIFESESECFRFIDENICLIGGEFSMILTMDKLRKSGYIRKSPVEEAEELIGRIKSFWCNNNQPYELGDYQLEIIHEAIQYLKSENERLRG